MQRAVGNLNHEERSVQDGNLLIWEKSATQVGMERAIQWSRSTDWVEEPLS